MKYLTHLNEQQKQYIASIMEDSSWVKQFDSFIEHSQLKEVIEMLLDNIELELFKDYKSELNKDVLTPIERENIKSKVQIKLNSIKATIRNMDPNHKIEVLIDMLCVDQELDFYEDIKFANTQELSIEEIEVKEQELVMSFNKSRGMKIQKLKKELKPFDPKELTLLEGINEMMKEIESEFIV